MSYNTGEQTMLEIGLLRQNMAALLRRAAVDEAFRRVCLEDASVAYLALTGQTLPAQYVVCFIEPEQEVSLGGAVRYVRLPPFFRETWLG